MVQCVLNHRHVRTTQRIRIIWNPSLKSSYCWIHGVLCCAKDNKCQIHEFTPPKNKFTLRSLRRILFSLNVSIFLIIIEYFVWIILNTNTVVGPPPPPLPPPLKAPTQSNHATALTNSTEVPPIQNGSNEMANANAIDNDNDSDELDSDFGLEVVEEPTLRPSELVRGNHNRTMSTISGELQNC